jgi:hypothetical protein
MPVAVAYDGPMSARARTATGRILHWRENPAPVVLACAVCGRVFTRRRSDAFAQGQTAPLCSQWCRDLANGLMLSKRPS